MKITINVQSGVVPIVEKLAYRAPSLTDLGTMQDFVLAPGGTGPDAENGASLPVV